jgi:HlyD family secretion protein
MLLSAACSNNDRSDGYGNFESTEIIVSSEASGRLLHFDVREGDLVLKGAVAAQIDTVQLHLTKVQLEAERASLVKKKTGIAADAGIYRQQQENLQRDLNRYRRLVSEGAVPSRQLEELENQARVIERQTGSVTARTPEIIEQIGSMDARIAQIADQIKKSTVRNPTGGTVLTTYVEQGELIAYGKPLYRVADLESMYLRAYLSGAQLSEVSIGDEVDVLVDGSKPADRMLRGRVTWISSKAEFTPKIIQTREDRVTMVYAVKVLVRNRNGILKIGMPGEMRFRKNR